MGTACRGIGHQNPNQSYSQIVSPKLNSSSTRNQYCSKTFALQEPRPIRLRVFFEPMPARSCTFWLTNVNGRRRNGEKSETKLKGGHKKRNEPKTAQSYAKSISNGTSHRQRQIYLCCLARNALALVSSGSPASAVSHIDKNSRYLRRNLVG
jgi:hypothetical protein